MNCTAFALAAINNKSESGRRSDDSRLVGQSGGGGCRIASSRTNVAALCVALACVSCARCVCVASLLLLRRPPRSAVSSELRMQQSRASKQAGERKASGHFLALAFALAFARLRTRTRTNKRASDCVSQSASEL